MSADKDHARSPRELKAHIIAAARSLLLTREHGHVWYDDTGDVLPTLKVEHDLINWNESPISTDEKMEPRLP